MLFTSKSRGAAMPTGSFCENNIFPLDKRAEYPIRFSYLKATYQWKMISAFIRIATQAAAENDCGLLWSTDGKHLPILYFSK